MEERGYWTKEQNKSETTKSGLLSQRDFAVTTVTTRSPRSLRGYYGHYAVTAVTTRTLRGQRAARSRQDVVAVDLEGSDFINASNLIHYTANGFKFDSIKRKWFQ